MTDSDEDRFELENVDLRRLLAQAGLNAAEQKVVERLQRILLEELHHRVKNNLAIVMAIVTQSLAAAESPAQARKAIEHRLIALGRVHDLLLKTRWTGTALAAIVQTAINPFETDAKNRFSLQTSDIEVGSAAVLPLSMVLHELCTNAVKYGALSNTIGRVLIATTVDNARRQFQLRWVETGGPAVQLPKQRSFGTRLIEHSFVSQLHGKARLSFEPSGVVCELDIPMESLEPPKQV